ncbi:MAG: PaaI family thioesterase [Bacteroidales bacterium]|nr:PaaI family thioesterase [Bacteroidales bacterium]
MKPQTHLFTSDELAGKIVKIEKSKAVVELSPLKSMRVDKYGLLHGGFIFGLADYAAMLAVNEPNVVLEKANVKFIKPVTIQEKIIAKAKIVNSKKNKYIVEVEVYNEQNEILFWGSFVCFVTSKHVLDK